MLYWVLVLIFWLSLMALFYAYVGYPICVALLVKVRKPRFVSKQVIYPFVSIIIAAYNEEDCIADTLENKLVLDYPQDKLEIIVVQMVQMIRQMRLSSLFMTVKFNCCSRYRGRESRQH